MKVFRYSAKDGFLVVLTIVQLAMIVCGGVLCGRISMPMQLVVGLILIFAYCTNYQCVAHNFLHNPFFKSNGLNNAFSVLNSMAIGVPQTLYRVHHLNHHKYNNDDVDPATGTTFDQTSTYRYSKTPGKEENIFAYTILGFLRTDMRFMLAGAIKKGHLRNVVVEAVAIVAFWAALAALNWRGFLFFVLPTWYLGQCSAMWENYLEHYGAIPGDRRTDSVSSYNRLYNFVWFNNGYHQEHHYKPQTHWTQIVAVRWEMLPETERRVVAGAHWFNYFPPPRSSYGPHKAP